RLAQERTLPGARFQVPPGITRATRRFVNPGAPLHLMAGVGGGGPDSGWRSPADWPWTAVRSDSPADDTSPFGWVRISSTRRSELKLQYFNIALGQRVSALRDEVVLVKSEAEAEQQQQQQQQQQMGQAVAVA
ncbi:MAG: hypothetical protein ACK4ZJ_17210, partial [Allorhizobium sp.]